MKTKMMLCHVSFAGNGLGAGGGSVEGAANSETKEQRDERMQWFRDAKFGMFIHWGPCSIGRVEIGWGRKANRPWDINGIQTPRTEDPVYDNYYKQFNPTKYNAEEWVRFAKESGMKYMVLIAKHHDGFAQFDTKVSDYNIMNSPYAKDIVKAYADACHKQGMKLGLYYSTRDWYHPDYLVGDNVKYDEFYRAQVKELLSNYGAVDVMWFDHVGGRDWGKWKFDELFSMMYQLQPKLIVNNRAAAFCGPGTPQDRKAPTPEIGEDGQGRLRHARGHHRRDEHRQRLGILHPCRAGSGPTAARTASRGRRIASRCW